MAENFKTIIGLGNPEPDYQDTYHNLGKFFVNELVRLENSEAVWNKKPKLFEYLKLNDRILVKPKTFMNESGEAVSKTLKFFKVRPEKILIVHDDSDLKIGTFKLAFSQSSAGHRGVDSIINALGTKDFWRLRIGIRPKEEKNKAGEIVLKKIKPEDKKIFASLVSKIQAVI